MMYPLKYFIVIRQCLTTQRKVLECIATFSFNYFEVRFVLSVWFFLVEGSVTFDIQFDLKIKHP